ncbi:MAG: 2-oxoacid:ferredoxin oxidoreductase subunit gamma [Nitrospirales bacterium]|nr:2-oxoacid:ferredoxin oxidoreductase subunit gamma [Nitrospirales bacterium]
MPNNKEERIIVAGSGGQGVLFLGKLIAYSGMVDGREVTWFPSYGAEMRGGTANCTVVLSEDMIGSPVVRNPHILIAMNDVSFQRFADTVLAGGIILYDSSLVNLNGIGKDIRAVPVPASAMAASLRNAKAANMVLMGALSGLSNAFTLESAVSTLKEMTPSHRREALETNEELMLRGYEFVQAQKN